MDWTAVGVVTVILTAVCTLLATFLRLNTSILETRLNDALRRIEEIEQHGSRHAGEVATELGYLRNEVERLKKWQS